MLRLKDLGVEWREIFSVLRGIVFQRLYGGNSLDADVLSVPRGFSDAMRERNGFVTRTDFLRAIGRAEKRSV